MTTPVQGIVREVKVLSGRRTLSGILTVPESPMGVVAFAHGSGSGRFSPRNQFVARVLQEANLATLLLDLLEAEECEDREKVFRYRATRQASAQRGRVVDSGTSDSSSSPWLLWG